MVKGKVSKGYFEVGEVSRGEAVSYLGNYRQW